MEYTDYLQKLHETRLSMIKKKVELTLWLRENYPFTKRLTDEQRKDKFEKLNEIDFIDYEQDRLRALITEKNIWYNNHYLRIKNYKSQF